MPMKRVSTCLLLLVSLCITRICLASPTVEVKDLAGRQVRVPVDPDRIACIGPGTLRLVVYLQAQMKVSGVEDMEKRRSDGRPYWIAHPELSRLPCCGPGGPASINKKPDLEALLSVRPQLILVTYMEKALADEVQRTLGIPVVVLSYGELGTFSEEIYKSLRIVGRILKRGERASEVIGYTEKLRRDLQARTRDIPGDSRPAAYVGGIGYRGTHGIESSEHEYMPLDWVGARNLAKKVEAGIGSHVMVGKELLLKLNPGVIFIDGGGLELVAEDVRRKPEYYNVLSAFEKKRVYTLLPFNWYATNVCTALADAYAIGKILYPHRFEDIDPEKKADQIYTFLVGKPVYEEMKAIYGPLGQKAPFLD